MSGLIWIQTVFFYSDVFLKFSGKNDFEKNIYENFPACKELKIFTKIVTYSNEMGLSPKIPQIVIPWTCWIFLCTTLLRKFYPTNLQDSSYNSGLTYFKNSVNHDQLASKKPADDIVHRFQNRIYSLYTGLT